MVKQILSRMDHVLFGVAFLLAHWRGFFFSVYVARSFFWVDALLWIVLCMWFYCRSVNDLSFARYRQAWARNWLVTLFILFCFASLLWTIDIAVSIYRLTVAVGATFVAAFLGVRRGLSGVVEILLFLFMLLAVGSVILVIAVPELAIMGNAPYEGSWRAVYWHRNYLGSAMAFASVLFLYKFIETFSARKREMLIFGPMYLLALLLVVKSRSATGVITCALLNSMFLLIWAWVRWHSRLTPRHYIFLGASLAALAVSAFFNLNVVFGFLGRNTSLTGRVPLWEFLVTNVLIQKPHFGFGFGALWADHSFRVYMQESLHWGYPILTADNGFMDILLYIGIWGLLLFVVVFVNMMVRFIVQAWSQKDLVSSIPVLLAVYALVANITLSHFFEIESFTWMMLVSFLFALSPRAKEKHSERPVISS